MSQQSQQKTALVTGSSNGIGEAIVKELAKLDYKLVVTGRSASDVGRVAEECAKLSPRGLKPLEVVADLEKEEEVERLFAQSMDHFGQRLHLLVNNAGFGLPVPHDMPDACYAAFKRVIQINLLAAVRLTLLAGPALKSTALEERAEAGGSDQTTTSIINIGSAASFRPAISLAAYGTSKAALNMYTSSMAVEMGPEIRVNCISPGPIVTKIVERSGFSLEAFKMAASSLAPLKRVGQSEEVAEAVLFLADPQKAGYISGANLTVDGGSILAPLKWD